MFPHLLLRVFLLLMPLKCYGFLTCDNDTDCKDGSSCIENICKICIKCSLIFREGKTCESDFNNCGDCLEGYKEISVTDNSSVKKPCKPIRKKTKLGECANDNNCPSNHYCSEKSCIKCFDCSLINRLGPEKCAEDPNECGPCFIGYLLIHDTSRTKYKKCEKVPHDPVPQNMALGSVSFAILLSIGVCVIFVGFFRKYTGSVFSKTVCHTADSSASQCNRTNALQSIIYCTETVAQNMGCEGQGIQQPKVGQGPSASYYPKNDENSDEISELHLEQNENSCVTDAPASAERDETTFSHRTAICGEGAGLFIGSSSNSVNSCTDCKDEQPADVNVLNNDSSENNSYVVTEDPAQVPEAPAREPTGDLP